MKTLISVRKQIFALAGVIGMITTYVVNFSQFKDLVSPGKLPYLLLLTYIIAQCLSFFRRKKSLIVTFLLSIALYSLVAFICLTFFAMTESTNHENVAAEFGKSMIIFIFGLHASIPYLVPAVCGMSASLWTFYKLGFKQK